ncbi:MAG TPA: GGDEF domain-containing protein, partial [Leptospiraceae bacterium]|nr:GGDEF domain-containing protein [Leptospiraceae bacterium]
MEAPNSEDKEKEIHYLRKIIDAYEKVTDFGNDELLEAYKIISAQEKVRDLAREELINATANLEELRSRETKITEEIMRILDEDVTNEELILHKLEALSKKSNAGFFADLFYVIANLELAEEDAAKLWQEIYVHRSDMCSKLGRSVSFRVALLDHILENNRVIRNPKIIELNLFDSVVKNSVVDELTTLYNRRYFNLAFKRELKRAKRYNRSICLFVFDVDDFKIFNDKYGHTMGDDVLRLIGFILKESFRQEDILCRCGGEEFAVILPEIDTRSALVACKRFSESLKLASVKKLQIPVTISGGVS